MENQDGKPKTTKGAKSKKQKPIVVSKENILYQPWKLIKSGYDATAFQQNVIISVLRKLKTSLSTMRDEYLSNTRQLSLFDFSDNDIYKEEDDAMTFSIHMKELGVEPQNYQRAFNAVCNIGDIDVWVPVPNPEGGPEELERAKLFTIIVNKEDVIVDENNQVIGYKYEKHNPKVKLKLRRNVAETLFQGQIHTFLEETAMNISEKFPKRLYMYFANYKNVGGVTIDYWKFRKQIGFEDQVAEKIQYPKFFDFRKRVLDPSVEKLREMAELGQAEYWFEYEPIYRGTGRAKAPDQLKFTIHLSQIGEDYEKQKGAFKERRELEQRLAEKFDQTTAQIRKLILALNADEYKDLNAKLDSLHEYFIKHRASIKDKRSYANRVLTDYIDEIKTIRAAAQSKSRQNENFSAAQSTDGELIDVAEEVITDDNNEEETKLSNDIIVNSHNLMTPEEFSALNDYIKKLAADQERKIILDALTIDKEGSKFIVIAPAKATYETFQQMYEAIYNDIDDMFDADVSLRIKNA